MNLEKYKKFLDGLGTLRGICDPQRERLSRRVPPSVTDGRWIERSRQGPEELPASPGGGRERWCFHGSASLPSFVLSLPLELGTKERWGSGRPSPREQLREPGEAAWQITTGKRNGAQIPAPGDGRLLFPRGGG